MTALVERLGHVVDRERLLTVDRVRADDRGRLDDLGQPVAMMAARPLAAPDVDDRRHDRAAQLIGQRAAVDEHTGRQVRADLGQVARDRGQRPFGLADAAPGERPEQAQGVRVLRVGEDRGRIALLDDLARVHDADPVAQRPDDAEVVGDQQDRRVGLRLEAPDQVQDARLDGGVEPGRGLVEDQQLRVRGQGDRDDDALLHPARQLVRIALGDPLRVGDLDPLECLASRWLRRSSRSGRGP